MIWSLKTLFEAVWLGLIVGLVSRMAPPDKRIPLWIVIPAGITGALLGYLVAWLLPVNLPWWAAGIPIGAGAGLGLLPRPDGLPQGPAGGPSQAGGAGQRILGWAL